MLESKTVRKCTNENPALNLNFSILDPVLGSVLDPVLGSVLGPKSSYPLKVHTHWPPVDSQPTILEHAGARVVCLVGLDRARNRNHQVWSVPLVRAVNRALDGLELRLGSLGEGSLPN